MKIYTVEILKDEAEKLLEELQNLIIIKLIRNTSVSTEKNFTALSLDTKGFTFNRDEANER